jgi:L-glyceraldehyde 3-phosphate reductase
MNWPSRPKLAGRCGPARTLNRSTITEEKLTRSRALNDIAKERGPTLAQMALAWVLRDGRVTSTLIGASTVEQLEDNVAAVNRLDFQRRGAGRN